MTLVEVVKTNSLVRLMSATLMGILGVVRSRIVMSIRTVECSSRVVVLIGCVMRASGWCQVFGVFGLVVVASTSAMLLKTKFYSCRPFRNAF